MSRDLSDIKLTSLVHSMAAYRSKTLTIGARILDRIILFASDKMQDWEFMESIKQFKLDLISDMSSIDAEYFDRVDKKTNEFLEKHGINVNYDNEMDVDIEAEQKDSTL